ncbi:glycosyltransferase family protein [Paracoccus aestuariivivens]|uniref:Glycosyl transferase n=1 Tax=Paracoccus aestuariivivens TaxID=1820333 RepID=A0A6L6JB89_9RHOB|nr:glycosyltransferase [Paracoccus aestuariivivens]MTH77897.1 glycosyl transferase [Paracoccus aestuariivivens]
MTRAPRIFFYVQHLLGIGHLARASRIATALVDRGAKVTLVTGGLPVAGFPPDGTRHFPLPPVQTAGEGFQGLADAQGHPVSPDFLDHRREMLLAAYRQKAPDVVITEAFPFGRRQMRFELLPLLEAIAQADPRPALCCSLRDILQEKSKPGRDEETVALVRGNYNHVLVHGDPAFAQLGDTFPLAVEITDHVIQTGLIAPPLPVPAVKGFDVVVSAGGGAVGEGLSRAAVEAARLLPDLRFCLICGPNMPQPIRHELQSAAATLPEGQVTIETFLSDFTGLLAASRLSVSQAGYNTVCDVLRAGCRAILIPFAKGGETEQTTRAERLHAKGWAGMLSEDALTGPALAMQIIAELDRPAPDRKGLNLDGAVATADILWNLAKARITN